MFLPLIFSVVLPSDSSPIPFADNKGNVLGVDKTTGHLSIEDSQELREAY